MESFRKLGINESLMNVLKELKFTEPSEIQEKTIPLVIQGKDVIGGSATGSGKTLAFGVGMLQNSERGKGIQALILTPTRELAEQIRKALHHFSKHNPLNVVSVYGGVSINPQIEDLRKADIVVGTPGRILDHLQRNTLNLRGIKTLVLDEADRMLDMGFIDDVEKIISQCPKKRQTLLFSATISREITRLSNKYMVNPVEVSAEQQVDPRKLKQSYYEVENDMKFSLLVHFLKHEKTGLVMVFCNTRHGVDYVAKNLEIAGIEAEPIHGGLSQNRRTRTLEGFHSGKTHVLVCSDVAARGLDIKGVSHVYNYDIPPTSKDYIHRIGRTARAGNEGEAISLLTRKDYENMRSVMNDSQINIKRSEIPSNVERVMVSRHPREGRFGRHRDFHGQHRPGRQIRHGSYNDRENRPHRPRPHERHNESRGEYRGYSGHKGNQRTEHQKYVRNPDGTYSKATKEHYGFREERNERRHSYRTPNSRPHFKRRY